MANIKTELGQLIDCTEEKFREFCSDKDLGYLSSFHNLMVQTYNEVKIVKDDLVKGMAEHPEKQEVCKPVLEGLYAKLLRIEQRVFILRELIKSRELPPPEAPASGT